MKRRTLVLPLLLTFVSAGATAHAEKADAVSERPFLKVRVDDLALDRATGAAQLHRRIDVAIARVCDEPSAHRLDRRATVLACIEHTRSVAHREADRLIGSATRLASSR